MSPSAKAPFQKHEVADYERRRYRGVDQRLVHRREVRILKELMSLIDEASPPMPSDCVLDAPCGYGRFSGLLAERTRRLVSCDLSAAMVERAVERGDIPAPSLGVVGDMTAGLPFKPGVFRFILSMRFFHHLHQSSDRRGVLREFARTAADWLILSFYQVNPLHMVQRRLRRKIKKSRTRIKMLTRREFEAEVEDAGFRVVRVIPLFKGIHAHHIALLTKRDTRGASHK
jgi:SAM-dependent methyltransferase